MGRLNSYYTGSSKAFTQVEMMIQIIGIMVSPIPRSIDEIKNDRYSPVKLINMMRK